MSAPAHVPLRVGTYNIRNTTDRYAERKPMMLDHIAHEILLAGAGSGLAAAEAACLARAATAGGAATSSGAAGATRDAELLGFGCELLGLQEVAFREDAPDDQPAAIVAHARAAYVGRGAASAAAGGTGADAAAAGEGSAMAVYTCPTDNRFDPPDPYFHIDGNAAIVSALGRAEGAEGATVGVGAAGTAPRLTVLRHELCRLSDVRSAQRLLVLVSDWPGAGGSGQMVWFVNTHLHHVQSDEGRAMRHTQATTLLEWMEAADASTSEDGTGARVVAHHTIIVGDFNSPPEEPAYAAFVKAGYTSAFAAVSRKAGAGSPGEGDPDDPVRWEPPHTFPTGLVADTMDTEPPVTTDYVWFRTHPEAWPRDAAADASGDSTDAAPAPRLVLDATAVRLVCNTPHPLDSTMYPSDHMGLMAELSLVPSPVSAPA